jgi:hypothetical protein
MNTFEKYVEQSGISSDSLQQAFRLLVAEETDDRSPEEMRAEIVRSVEDSAAVDNVLRELSQDPMTLDAAAKDFLAEIWGQPGGEKRVKTAIDGTNKALPVIEVGIIAIAAMYIAYLHYTGGVKSEKKETTTRKDGTKTESSQRTLYGATGPLGAIVQLLKGGVGS